MGGREKLALYGCGKMGMALLNGWLEAANRGGKAHEIAVFDPALADELGALDLSLNPDRFEADIVVLAVKPQIMPKLLAGIDIPQGALIISIAAGLPVAFFERALGADRPIIRTMPNTPSAIGAGITAIIGNQRVDANAIEVASELMRAVGEIVVLDDEAQMDAVTALSGSGPAYLFHMIEAMIDAGIGEGLTAKIATELTLATLEGAARLARESGEGAGILRKNVTSPGGTTEAALEVLMREKGGLRSLMTEAVGAAANRSRALGKA